VTFLSIPPSLHRKDKPQQRRHRPDQLQTIQIFFQRQAKKNYADARSQCQTVAFLKVQVARIHMNV